MAFTVRDIISNASTVLVDGGGVRWPYAELLQWVNLAVSEIAVLKPSATAETIEIALVKGTLQALPPTHHMLLAVHRNLVSVSSSPDGRAGGRAITTIQRDELDAQIPNWHDPSVLPYSQTVMHVIDHPSDPEAFFVAPGNNGTGIIEVLASRMNDPIPVPASPELLASYQIAVPLNDAYETAVLDYVLYRAFSKDMAIPSAAARAQAHFTQFSTALGIKATTEAENTPSAPKTRFNK